MIWQNPWAWLGAGAIVLPIAIHLLGRGHAKIYRFPSLRFVRASRLLPTRRTTIHDPWLLALRVAILITAAAALAQPLLDRAGRRADVQRRLSRAIVVDTSASMRAVMDSAMSAARGSSHDADASITIATNTPSAGLRSAATWLARQSGRRELMLISDFARGTVDSSALANVPGEFGLRLIRLAAPPARAADVRSLRDDSATVAHLDIARDAMTVRWTTEGVARASQLRVIGAPAETAQAAAVIRAVRHVGVAASYDSSRQIAIALPGYASRASLPSGPPREPWMIDLLTRISVESPIGTELRAAQQDSGGRPTLLLFCDAQPASLPCASLMAGVLRANTSTAPVSELEPERISDDELTRWQRAPGPGSDVHRIGDWLTGPSDGRWLWGIVLLLLAAETLLRRQRSIGETASPERVHDIAA